MPAPDYIDGIPVSEYNLKMTKISKEKLIQLYIDQGKSVKDIAKYFKCSYRTIYRRLKRLNIALRPENRKKKPKVYLGKRQLEKILNETDWTIDQIAKKLRATPETVRRYIEKYGL